MQKHVCITYINLTVGKKRFAGK